MTTEEKAILDYMKTIPHGFVSGREIAKRVGGKRRYEEDRTWAVPFLAAMVQAGMLEKDPMGHFRITPESSKRKKKTRAYVSPHILRILKSSGKNFESITIDEDLDENDAIKPLNAPPSFDPPDDGPSKDEKKPSSS